jgi:hypothetical protein
MKKIIVKEGIITITIEGDTATIEVSKKPVISLGVGGMVNLSRALSTLNTKIATNLGIIPKKAKKKKNAK